MTSQTVTFPVQEECIDLPGQVLQCTLRSNKLKVILRKQRDVIFDLKLGDGKSYTVEATQSDFYNARDKKLVYALAKEKVTFKDGERMHLWITRGFKGELILKSDGVVMMRLEPNKLDPHHYSADPKEKPAPIIIALGKSAPASISTPPAPAMSAKKPSLTAAPVMSSPSTVVDEECSVVCVVEGKLEGMPGEIFNYFKKGGGKSGLADIDPNDVPTRNWIIGQTLGSLAYIGDNWKWLWASMDGKTAKGFQLVKAQVHLVRGKVRFYFSGYSRTNSVFGSGGFGPSHDRILTIFGGAGKTESAFAASMKGILGSFRGYAAVSFIFGSWTAYAEWKDDVKKDGYDLAAALFTALVKAIVVAVLVTIAVAAIVFFVMIIFGMSIPVILVGGLTVIGSIGINYFVEAKDKQLGKTQSGDQNNTDGLATVIAPMMRKASHEIQASWHYLMEKFQADYKELSF